MVAFVEYERPNWITRLNGQTSTTVTVPYAAHPCPGTVTLCIFE
jgi:hypothetical protein